MAETVQISELGAQGDGVTDAGLFIAGALPGETVRASVAGHRAALIEIVQRSASRVEPICPHFGTCGGCTLQHAADDFLADWKRDLVARALAARAIECVDIAPTLTSPPASRRRAVFSGRRTKKGTLVGFHAPQSNQLIEIGQCPVVRQQIVDSLEILHELVALGGSRKGEVRFTVTDSEAGLDIAATGGKELDGGLYGRLVAATATTDIARLTWDGEPVIQRDPPRQTMGRAQVVPPPGGFLQATVEGEAALVAAVRRGIGQLRRVADLFAGCGTFTLPLAEEAEVTAFEADVDALAALDAGWRQAEGLKRVETRPRDLFARPLLAREFADFDAAVLDPPRQGARAQCEHLAAVDLQALVMVSCNPATFARDVRILVDGGWRLDWVQPIDQFRWTPHVELAAGLSR